MREYKLKYNTVTTYMQWYQNIENIKKNMERIYEAKCQENLEN